MYGLGAGLHALEGIAAYSKELETVSQDFSDLYYRLQDLGHSLGSMREQTVFSPAELDAVESRSDLLYRLKKKYGATVEEMLAYLDKCRRELAEMESADDPPARLAQQLEKARKAALDAGMNGHIPKPIDVDLLRQQLGACLPKQK